MTRQTRAEYTEHQISEVTANTQGNKSTARASESNTTHTLDDSTVHIK